MRIISLDASTKTVGISIFEKTDKISLLHYEYYKPNKKLDILEYVKNTRDYILGLCEEYNVDELIIEDFAKFMAGKSSATTIISLAIMNTSIRMGFLDKYNKYPVALNVTKIRNAIKIDHRPSKEEIPEVVAKNLGIEFPWYYKINRKTKQKQIMEESFDVADSMAVGLAYLKIISAVQKKKGKRG